MILVGIAGQARTGKDTVAQRLVTAHRFYQYSFAAPIKAACRSIFGWSGRHTDGDLKDVVDNEYGISPRVAMQTLGTEWGREMVHPELWVVRANNQWNKVRDSENLSDHNGMVVSDVRFNNEADWIRKCGGHVLHLRRDNKQEVTAHKSEDGISVKDGDLCIDNNDTLDDLHFMVDKMAEAMMKGEYHGYY